MKIEKLRRLAVQFGLMPEPVRNIEQEILQTIRFFELNNGKTPYVFQVANALHLPTYVVNQCILELRDRGFAIGKENAKAKKQPVFMGSNKRRAKG